MKYQTIAKVTTLLLLLSSVSVPLWADKIKPLKISQLASDAEFIFEGECIDVKSGKDSENGLISTWYTFRILKGLKGDIGETFTLKQYGGTDGETTLYVPTVKYEKGERIVLFLYGNSRIGFSSAVGQQQGKFLVREAPQTGIKYVTNGVPSVILFEDMDETPSAVNEKGVRIQGTARLRSDKLERDEFLNLVERLVEEQARLKKQ